MRTEVSTLSEQMEVLRGLGRACSGMVFERSYLPVGPSAPHRPGTSTPSATRALSTMARRAFSTRIPGSSCGYATAASTECKVALIGAHGYTGQALTTLLSGHRYLNLSHVSSRRLAGYSLEGYTKAPIT
jgi:N-acetyl-gamma-glutamyl-phosphate reductase/acetylglutamate kinase